MGQCTSKQANLKKQNEQMKKETRTNNEQTGKSDKMRSTMVKYDDKIINSRQSKIMCDGNKEEQLLKKLQLIKSGKYDQAGIKPQNAYFEMIKIQKQIELYQQKIQKSKTEINKFQERKTQNA